MDLEKISLMARELDSMQKPAELKELIDFLQDKKIKSIVEIGVSAGGTTSIFKTCFSEAQVIGVDCCVLPVAKEKQKKYNFILVEGDSKDEAVAIGVVSLLPKRYIDFLFIDGEHSYENIKKDFETWFPYARIIAFHDIQKNTSQK
jgi:cephalosporin hydroxylase